MRKLLIVILLVVMLVTVSGMSLASSQQVQVYMLDQKGGWEAPVSCLGLHAKAFTSSPQFGMCDKMVWTETFTNHVCVSQWISYCFAGTRWDWQIRKPGTFAADCISFSIQSNDDVNVAFSGFDNLAPQVHPDAPPIKVWYNYGDPGSSGPPATNPWIAAPDLNLVNFSFPYDQVKDGIIQKLWNKIEILGTTRACDYENSGTITLTLTDVKPFINPENGDYKDR